MCATLSTCVYMYNHTYPPTRCQVETERYSNRCSPQTIQKYSLGGVGASVAITFLVVVIIACASISAPMCTLATDNQ